MGGTLSLIGGWGVEPPVLVEALYHSAGDAQWIAVLPSSREDESAPTAEVCFRMSKHDHTRCTVELVFGDPYLSDHGVWRSQRVPLHYDGHDELFAHFSGRVQPQFRRLRYAFVVTSAHGPLVYADRGLLPVGALNDCTPLFALPYLHSTQSPEWVRSAVVYQIFPDRFCRIVGEAEEEDSSVVAWNSVPPRFDTFYGGNLAGIQSKLAYLETLGVTVVYLCPIFKVCVCFDS